MIGQPNFTTSTATTTQWSVTNPVGVAVEPSQHRLYVADNANSRIMVFDTSALANGMNASSVIGQANFTGASGNTTQNTLNSPAGIAVDATNSRLFVADYFNDRVMVFNTAALATGMNASSVIGQADFVSFGSATTQNGLNTPSGVDIDTVNNRLYVVDRSNNRVLMYNASALLTTSTNATTAIGQINFTSSTGATTQSGESLPYGVLADPSNNRLYVADTNNRRILVYNTAALATGMNASSVIGEANFTTIISTTTQSGDKGIYALALDAARNRLFAADLSNNRILVYDTSAIADGMNATAVIGQASFTASAAATTQSGLSHPEGLAYDASSGMLYVGDNLNNRVLAYKIGSYLSLTLTTSTGIMYKNQASTYPSSTFYSTTPYDGSLALSSDSNLPFSIATGTPNATGTYTFGLTAASSYGYFDTETSTVSVVNAPNGTTTMVSAPIAAANALTATTTDVVITTSTYATTSTISFGTSTALATLNLSLLTSVSGTTTTATITPPLTVSATSSYGAATAGIASGTALSVASSSWDGIVDLLVPKATSTLTNAPTGTTPLAAYELGVPNTTTTLSRAVRLLFTNQSSSFPGYLSGGSFVRITTACSADSQTVGDALPAGGDCAIASGNDLVVWTKHFTEFGLVGDTTPPTVAMTAPTDGATVSGTVTVTATATDNIAVASVAFELDGSTIGTATSSPYTISWDASSLAAGSSHTLTALATDSSGNTASSSITVKAPAASGGGTGLVFQVGGGAGTYPTTTVSSTTVAASSTPAPTTAASSSPSIASLESQLASLRAALEVLIQQATAQGIPLPQGVASSGSSGSSGSPSSPAAFSRDLALWDRGADVMALQEFLNAHGFPLAAAGNGSLGHETMTFGYRLYHALVRFQEANGIPGTGYFGPLTRGRVEELF